MKTIMKSINVSYSLTSGNEFDIQLGQDGKRFRYIHLDRKSAIEIAQQLLEGLKETKKTYNDLVKSGKQSCVLKLKAEVKEESQDELISNLMDVIYGSLGLV